MNKTVEVKPNASHYLRTLMEPAGPKISGVPDSHFGPSRLIRLKSSVDVNFSSSGTARIICTPEANGTVLMEQDATTNISSPVYYPADGGNGSAMYHNTYGSKPGIEFDDSPLYHSSKSRVTASKGCGLPATHVTGSNAAACVTVDAWNDPSSLYNLGKGEHTPAIPCVAGDTVKVYADIANATASNLQAYCVFVVAGDYVLTTATAQTGPVTPATAMTTVTAPTSTEYLVEAGVVAVSATIYVASISYNVSFSGSTRRIDSVYSYGDDLASFMEGGVLRARPVGAQYWVQWAGGTVYDGSIKAAPILDGSNPLFERKWQPGQLNGRVGAYTGNASLGVMCHYAPNTKYSTEYRELRQIGLPGGMAEYSFSDTCFVIDITVSNTAAQTMRVVTDLVVEIQSSDKVQSPSYTKPNVLELEYALHHMHSKIGLIHENNSHLSMIAKVFKKYATPVAGALSAVLAGVVPGGLTAAIPVAGAIASRAGGAYLANQPKKAVKSRKKK